MISCAFVESLLRHSGYKTGLFTSPHLIEVRERIKINGKSLSYEKFRQYLDHCYQVLVENWVRYFLTYYTTKLFHNYCILIFRLIMINSKSLHIFNF